MSRTPLDPLGLGGSAGGMSGPDARADPLAAAEGLLRRARPTTARPGTAMGARPGSAARGGRPPLSPTSSPRAEVMTLDGTGGSIAEDSHDGLDESAEISYGDSFEADASLLRSTDVNGSAMDMSSDDAGFYDNEAGTGGGAEMMTFSQDNISDNIILEDDSIGDSISIDMSSTPASPLHSPAARPKSAPRHDVDFSMSVGDDTLGDASISMDAEEFNTAVQTRPETANRRAATRPISAKGRPRGSPPPPPPPEQPAAAAAPWAGALSDGDDDDDDVEIVDERGFTFPPSPRSPAAVEAEGATEALHRQLSGNDPMEQLRAFERDEGLSPDTHGMSPKSPAAVEAEDETDALHRMLAGNDPVSSLRAQFSPPEENKNEMNVSRSNTGNSVRITPHQMSVDESVAEEVADESAAALEVLDESAEEIATEPRTSRRFHAEYTETFESMDASKLLAEDEEAPEDVPRDANGSKETRRLEVSDVSMDPSSSNDGSGDLGSVGAKAKALLHDLRAIRRGGKPSGKDVVELTKLLRELQTATHRRRVGLARRAGAVVASSRPGKEDFTSAFANPGGKRIQTQKPAHSEPEPPLESSYETTREEWSAYLVGEGAYPAGAPHPLGLDHDTKSYREIWNAQQLHEKLRDACENLRDATERPADTSTYRAVAAALQAHSVNGILRAKVGAIQMRLRSAAQKRELQRARATARA